MIVARLGPNAFQDMNYWAATTALITISSQRPSALSMMCGIDVSGDKSQVVKASMLADRVPARLQTQLHKHIWGADVKGV